MRIDFEEIVGIVLGVIVLLGIVTMIVLCSSRTDQQLKVFEQHLNRANAVEQLAMRMK